LFTEENFGGEQSLQYFETAAVLIIL
jgi:hypothetical protein